MTVIVLRSGWSYDVSFRGHIASSPCQAVCCDPWSALLHETTRRMYAAVTTAGLRDARYVSIALVPERLNEFLLLRCLRQDFIAVTDSDALFR